MISNQKR